MAIASSSSSSSKWTYDVFLSFKGKDTRTNFVDHLYTALSDRSIYTFKDDHNLNRGQSISPALIKAIEESRFAVVVFSRNYAESSWCLDELAKIVDCKNSIGQTVLTVFYDVDPCDVRKQRGCFEKAFAKHEWVEVNNKEEEQIQREKIQRWRNALAEAASISGWYLPNIANGHESQCIKQIVGNILTNLGHSTTSSIAENLIGIESRVQNVRSLLCLGSDDVHILGIWGMGGMGKTTVASAVFYDIANQFEGRSFVANVREVSKSSGLQFLQEKILSEVLMERELKVRSVDEGIDMMSRLCRKRVLLVLDDVDHVNQLEALAGKRDWFGRGSRIIITTRDEHLLKVHGVNEIHRAVLLNNDEALLLFNRYAFKSNSPPEEYVEPSRLVVRNVGRLPLALKVLGSFLCGRDMIEWKSALDRLKHVGENEILDVLKISFDGLNHFEKEIFLDIACFFRGMKKDDVSKILDSFDFYPDIGISVLIEKSLVTVSNGTLEMHDLMQEMGQNIVYQMDPKEPGRRSRLWLPEDIHAVLTKDTGTEAIEGIKLDRAGMMYSGRAFRNMKKLRLIHVSLYVENFQGPGPEYLSNELRWIYWYGYPSKSLPASFQAEKLVSLDMPCSNIVELWKGKKNLPKLKFVNLDNSYKLTRIPDFSGAPNLERLNLVRCTNLKEVHHSLGDLKRLVVLDFSRCTRLKSFSSDSFNMTSLEILIISYCEKLEVFPQILGNMKRLSKLYLNGTAIKELHPSIGKLTGLLLMDLNYCKKLRFLPSNIGCLKHMKTLNLSGCSKLKEFPEALGQMEGLEELRLRRTAIRQLPSSIVLLKNLKTLTFGGSERISLSTSFLSSLSSSGRSPYSMDLLWQSLPGFLSLKKLTLSYCNLSEIPGDLCQLSSLEELSLCGNYFTCLPNRLCQLSQLKILLLKDCPRLEALHALPSSIAILTMDDCESLESLADLSTQHELLHDVSFINCFKLTENEHCSSSCSFADMLLQTLLQGRSVINHHFSILLPGREITDWFTHQGTGQIFSDLQLLPDWHTRIMGFAMCFVFKTTFPDFIQMIIFSGANYRSLMFTNSWYRMLDSDHVWMGYISLDFFLQQSRGKYNLHNKDDRVGTEGSYLRVRHWSSGTIEKFRIRAVLKEDVKQMIEDHSSQSCNFGFFPPKYRAGTLSFWTKPPP